MKTARPYDLKEQIYRLCNKEQYFTCGSCRQYDKMFEMAVAPEYTYRDVAMAIWICSDDSVEFSDIQNQIETIWNDIEEAEALSRLEEQQAAGERAADEVYCSCYE